MKYRKKPELVDAIQYDGTNGDEIKRFTNGYVVELEGQTLGIASPDDILGIGFPEDYVIRLADGNVRIMGADEFVETYERVTTDNLPLAESWVSED